jgi:dipeptidyl aminopeptidase/acylaminoacyl peptidase
MNRKLIVGVCLLSLLTACAVQQQQQEAAPREVRSYSIEEFLGTTNFGGASLSPDKSKVLVHNDSTGVYNAYVIPTAGGDPMPITESTTDAILVRSYFPADERFLYSSDQGGNELNHIYVYVPEGDPVDLTPGEELKASFAGWSQDDTTFYVTSNERDARFFDLYEYSADDYRREMVYRNDAGLQVSEISPDKRYIALGKPNTTSDSDIMLYDRESDEMKLITEHEGWVANSAQAFSPDSSSLYYTTDEGSEFRQLVRYDIASGEREVVMQPEWDVLYAYFSKHGKYLVVGINNDARTELRIMDTETMTPVALPGVPDADITSVSISRDESTMAFYVSSSRRSRDLWIWEIGGGDPRRLTDSLNPGIDSADLVDGEVVRFASYDGVEIPGILYKPHAASAENKVPALVWVHGGPGGQSRIGYSAMLQYLVNHGYAVYAINNRGSSGYGKSFYQMDDRKHGEADLGDCIASKQMLIDTGYVDPEKIGIIGGSYGGYMVLAALAFQPEEFEVGIDIFGVANWVRTLESIPPWWESMREALYAELGDPAEDGERLRRISPLFHAENIDKPLLVLQGANDPRVLQVESDEMVEAARANGTPVDYVIFEDEGHGFRKKDNQLTGYKKVLDFLDEHLKAEPAG